MDVLGLFGQVAGNAVRGGVASVNRVAGGVTAVAERARPAADGGASAAVSARRGAAKVQPDQPLVDFPGITAGTEFDIVAGSKIGAIGVRGKSKTVVMDPDRAVFESSAGRFGINFRTKAEIERVDGDAVLITSSGKGIPAVKIPAHVAENRTNFVRFQHDGKPKRESTSFRHDGKGNVTMRAVAPGIGDVVLKLRRIDA